VRSFPIIPATRRRLCSLLRLLCHPNLGALILLLAGTTVNAQETFEEYLKAQNQSEQRRGDQFARYKDSVTAAYERFLKKDREDFERYLGDIRNKWGKSNTRTSSAKEWVSYEGDFLARRSVNFEKGEASVEVLVQKSTPAAETRQLLQQQIVEMISDRGNSDPLEVKLARPSDTPVLDGLLKTSTNGTVSPVNAETYAGEIVSSAPVRQQSAVGADGASRVAARVTFKLIPDHIRVRAERYGPTVAQYATQFNVDAPLVYAVIHTESCFNPRAKSSAPAFGLMQLVPSSGARVAHVYVHGEDRLVTPEYLYDPSNNVELGTAYLALLMSKDFKNVQDPLSRQYCAIAAYNTGPANVAKTFAGKRDLQQAAKIINTLSPDEVFNRMRAQLPFVETRQYIANVTDRKRLYEESR
jgi:membrane-bound lytic murein transglycosylase C